MSLPMPKGVPKGYAYGLPQINNDSIFFRAGSETWEFPATDVLGYKGIATSSGPYYIAKVKDLCKMERENGLRRKK